MHSFGGGLTVRSAWSNPTSQSSPGSRARLDRREPVVFRMAKNVNGQLAIMATAPVALPTWPVCHHAASPGKKPKMANGACIAVPVCMPASTRPAATAHPVPGVRAARRR